MSKYFYRGTWTFWTRVSPLFPDAHRDNFLAIFGPASLLFLLVIWGSSMVIGFALVLWGLHVQVTAPESHPTFLTYWYLSATTFVTLGYGDIAPRSVLARTLADIEAGTGFGFLAIVIGYLPVLYGAFSRRESEIALLDARASSPPSAGAMLQRLAQCPDMGDLLERLRSHERWSAELLESHLSYPVLMWYRSQHDRQSWLSTLTTILDTCALLIAYAPDSKTTWQARMTFAMSRHAAVDLSLIFDAPPTPPKEDRLPPERLTELLDLLQASGMPMDIRPEAATRLNELRYLYEPFVNSLSRILVLALPSWMPNPNLPDNWQTSAWDREDHFFQTPTQTQLVRGRTR